MKKFSIALFIGVIVALPLIYLLRPLNKGAIGLLIFLCVGLVGLIQFLIPNKDKNKPNANDHAND